MTKKQRSAKDLVLRPIPRATADDFIRTHHYSRKVVPNTQVNIGAFLDNVLHGAIQLGPPINRKGTLSTVEGSEWNEVLEINRLAFDGVLPRNSESRALGVMRRLLRTHAPHVKWLVSFADAVQCGDGTIYRAAGFLLVGYHSSDQSMRINPHTGRPMHIIQAHHLKVDSATFNSWERVGGYQLKYVVFLDPAYRERLAVPVLPYSTLDEIGARMYRGHAVEQAQHPTAPAVRPRPGRST